VIGTRHLVAAGAVVALVPLAGCTGGSSGGSSAGRVAASPAAQHVQWWSGGDYCGMLRQTVRAGRSILPGVGADDPTRLATTKAFVADLERSAPASVSGAWHVLGPAVVKIVASGGNLRQVKGIDPAAVQHAATAIAAHAKAACHVDVSHPAA